MSKTIQKIISFKTTDTNKSFCLEVYDSTTNITSKLMYFGDIEKTNSYLDGSYNKCCLRNVTSEKTTIYPALYNVKDLYLKSSIYGNNIESDIPNTNLFLNVFDYRLSSDLTNLIQVQNYIYQLNNMSIYGKQQYDQDIYAELSVDNGYNIMPNVKLSTLLFDLQNVADAMISNDIEISVKSNIDNIMYNLFLEIPGNIENDYDSGNYAATTYTTKNLYDCQYDMTHDVGKLNNARKYIAIDHCNNQIYLKYYDNVRYNPNQTILNNGKYGHTYQKIEVIKAVNRYEALNVHKTNYYDVDIVCEKLLQAFNNEINESSDARKAKITKVKLNIISEILNCIQDICKKISPIDTLLVKVNVYESEIDVK